MIANSRLYTITLALFYCYKYLSCILGLGYFDILSCIDILIGPKY